MDGHVSSGRRVLQGGEVVLLKREAVERSLDDADAGPGKRRGEESTQQDG